MGNYCKRLLSLLMVLFMVISMIPGNIFQVYAAEAETATDTDVVWTTVDGVASGIDSDGVVGLNAYLHDGSETEYPDSYVHKTGATGCFVFEEKIADAFSMNVTWYANNGNNITIDFNGNTITSDNLIRAFEVAGNATLTLMNGTIRMPGQSDANGGLIHVSDGSTLKLINMKLESTNATVTTATGGVIYAEGSSTNKAEVILENATIIGAPEAGEWSMGGALYLQNTDCYMYSGKISGGHAVSYTNDNDETVGGFSGNVHIRNGSKFYMYGGEISGGVAARQGGNIGVRNTGEFHMYGGTISGGVAANGGNVGFANSGKFYMYGGTVSDGKVSSTSSGSGGNMYIAGEGAKLYMYGGGIEYTGSTRQANEGGNLYITGATQGLEMYGGTISGGKAKNGGNIYTASSAKVELYGGTITGGTAALLGGNIYLNRSPMNIYSATVEKGEAVNTTKASGQGGNIYAIGAAALIHMYGGSVTEGTASGHGGNIEVQTNAKLYLHDGGITNGTAANDASTSNGGVYGRSGNVYAYNGQFYMYGGTVSGGTSKVGTAAVAYGSSALVEQYGGSISGSFYIGSSGTINLYGGTQTSTNNVTNAQACENHVGVAGTTVAPTCLKQGYTNYSCAACSESWTGEIVDPTACADKTSTESAAATCLTPAYTKITCTDCGVVEVTIGTAATGHTKETVAGTAETCTETGLTDGSKCSVCDQVLSGQITLAALGHDPVKQEEKTATCVNKGNDAYWKCSRCDVLFEDNNGVAGEEIAEIPETEINATNHASELEHHEAKAVSCLENGNLEYWSCASCEKNYSDVNGTSLLESVEIEAAGEHGETRIENAADATVDAPGYTGDEVCNVCGATVESGQEIPQLTAVAQIGETKYASLAEAFAAAQPGDVVELLADITVTDQIKVADNALLADITLDGNDHIITAELDQANESVLYMGDTSGAWATGVKIHDLTIEGTARFAIMLVGGTSSELTNVKISGNYVYGINLYGTHGATMTNCVIDASVFANGQDDNPLKLVSTTIQYLAANRSEAADGAKVFIDENSSVGELYFWGDSTIMIDPASFARITKIDDELTVVAAVDGVRYTNLQAAIDAADGKTVTVLEDIQLSATVTVPEGTTVTLDLNGKTISQSRECTASYSMVENKGSLTITGNGKLSFTDTGAGDPTFGWGAYTLTNRGTLVVENGTIENLSTQNDGTGNNVHAYFAIQQAAGTTTIKNGTISTPTYRSIRVNKGDLIIENGTFDGQIWLQPNQGDAAITISGGTFEPNSGDASAVFLTNAGENYTVSAASVTGGTFNGKIGVTDTSKLAGFITGGTFSANAKAGTNEALLADSLEFAPNDDGTYGLVEKPVATGTITPGYTRTDGVWGEASANASESFYVELYVDDTKIATTQLNNIGGIIDGDVYVTWSIPFAGSVDEYWTVTWEEGYPDAAQQPTKVMLYCDGEAVAENAVQMNAPDDLNPVIWEDVVNAATMPIQVTYADGSVEYFDDMLEAVPHKTNYPKLEGATVTLLKDISAPGIRMMENDMVLDLNGHTYTIIDGTGSQGTNTSGFQIRPEITTVATIKNGTIQVAEGAPVVWMFNVYATNFVVEDVTIDCANMAYSYGSSVYTHVSRSGDNTQFLGGTKFINFKSEVAGAAINVGGTMTIADTVVPGGSIELDPGAALTAAEGLDVSVAEDCKLVYAEGTYTAVPVTYVAQVGETKYESLQDAIDAADGETVTLLADVDMGEDHLTVAKGQTVTLELAGYTISGEQKTTATKNDQLILNNGTLTVQDSSDAQTGTITFAYSGEQVYLSLSTISNSCGTLTVKSGTITNTTDKATHYAFAFAIDNLTNSSIGAATVNIEGGEVTSAQYRAIRQFANSTTTANTVNVTGGTVEGGTDEASTTHIGIWLQSPNNNSNLAVMNVTGGQVSEIYIDVNDGTGKADQLTVNVSAGCCSAFQTDLPDGYVLEQSNGIYGLVKKTYVAQIGDTKYETLQEALDAAAAGTGAVTVEILCDIDLTGVVWAPVTVSAPGYPVVTVNGNNKTITGLNDMLFAGTWAGGSGLIINDLTIKESNIVNDENDSKGTVGVGAFIGYPQASATITLSNCHLVNSTVKGGHWTGGLIGMAGGYNGNDGPVFMDLTITGCSVTGSTITGEGSVGGVIGHGSCAAWTNVVIEDTTVTGNTITSTGSSTVKAGVVMGTIGAAGQETTAAGETKTGGAYVAVTESGNAVTSNGTAITTIYGRQGTSTGVLTVTGGSYENYPIEENVSYAAPAAGYLIQQGTDGTYVLAKDPAYGKVAQIGDTYYETLAEAFTAAQDGDEVVILSAGTYTLSTSGKDITITGAVDGVVFDNIGKKNMGDANVTFNNVTFDYYPNVNYTGLQHSGALVYNNCTFNGQVFLYGTSETFNDCTFNQNSADAYNVWTYSAEQVAFEGCTFNCAGKSVLIYCENGALYNEVSVTDCDFVASAPVEGKAAIEMDSSLTAGIGLTIDGETTSTGFGTGNVSGNSLWNNKKDNKTEANNDITVTVDEVVVLQPMTAVAKIGDNQYYSLAEALEAATDGDTVYLLTDVALDANIVVSNMSITFDGQGHTISQGEALTTLNDYAAGLRFQGTSSDPDAYNYTVQNVVFDGWKTRSVLAIHQCAATVDNVTIQNTVWDKNVQAMSCGLLYLENTEITVKNSKFLNNIAEFVLTYNYGSPDSVKTLTIDNCEFTDNTVGLNAAAVYYVDGTGCTITNTKFVGNDVTSGSNGATVYLGFMENCVVTGCLFQDNTVRSTGTSTRVAGALFFGYGAEISGNAFVNNTASNANGSEGIGQQVCTSVAYTDIDLSGNYWNGVMPVDGVDYLVQHRGNTDYANADTILNDYYTAYAENTENEGVILSGLVNMPSADMTYSAYGFDTSGEGEKYRENFAIDLYDINAQQTLAVELYSNGTLVATTTLRQTDRDDDTVVIARPLVNNTKTVNVVVAGRLSGSWDTVWHAAPSVAYIPDTVKVYADGILVDTFENAFEADDQAAYAALPGVEKAAAVYHTDGTVTYYAELNAALTAAQEGETVMILAGEYDAFSVNKAITVVGETDAEGNNLVDLNGKLSVTGTGVTVKNLNVNNSSERAVYVSGGDILIEGCNLTGVHGLRYCYANNGDVTLKDCVITGSTYGVHFDAGNGEGNVIIDGCTITGWTSFGSAIEGVTITDTTFCDGNYDTLRFYQSATLEGCTFSPATTIDFGKNEVRADLNNCSVSDGSPLTDVVYLGDIANMGVQVYEDGELIVVEAKIGNTYYLTLEEAVAAAQDGDTVTVLMDVSVTDSLLIESDITLDLNGFTVSAEGLSSKPVIRVLADVTVTGGTVDGTTGTNSYAFIVGNSETAGTLNIADGTYKGVTSAVSITNGTANISGGTFSTAHDGEGTDYGAQYLLNCMDAAYKAGTAVYNITGGTFLGFNPENNAAEGAKTNFTAEGYGVIYDGSSKYTVAKTPELPTATVTMHTADSLVSGNAPKLTFAMNFLADDATEEQLAYYGNWYADFVLTVNKKATFNADSDTADGYLAGQYDNYDTGWLAVPFEDVTLEAGQSLKIMEYAAELMGQPGLKFTYEMVYDFVKNFDCGIYFTPEFLAANPDLEVTLELRMYNNADETVSAGISELYTYTTPVAVIESEEKAVYFETMDAALAAAQAGETVTMLTDAVLSEAAVKPGVTVDLNGCALTGDVIATLDINGGTYTTTMYAMAGGEGFLYETTDAVIEMASMNEITVKSGTITLGQSWRTLAGQTLTIAADAAFVIPADTTMEVNCTVIVDGTLTVDGEIQLTDPAASVKAAQGLNVTTELEGYLVEYIDGAYVLTELGDRVAQNTVTGAFYTDITDALNEAVSGQTVILLTDVSTDKMLMVMDGITLDLNGNTLQVNNYLMAAFSDSYVIDSSEDNSGLLAISLNKLRMLDTNPMLPIAVDGGYKFVEVKLYQHWSSYGDFEFWFDSVDQLLLDQYAAGRTSEDMNISIQIEAVWDGGSQLFDFDESVVSAYIAKWDVNSLYLNIKGTENVTGLKYKARVVFGSGTLAEVAIALDDYVDHVYG